MVVVVIIAVLSISDAETVRRNFHLVVEISLCTVNPFFFLFLINAASDHLLFHGHASGSRFQPVFNRDPIYFEVCCNQRRTGEMSSEHKMLLR